MSEERSRPSEMGAIDDADAKQRMWREHWESLPPFTVEDAKRVIEGLKRMRPTCDSCDEMAYHTVFDALRQEHGPRMNQDIVSAHMQKLFDQGWEPMVDRAGIVQRCATCASSAQHPWAGKLDPKRVVEWVVAQREAAKAAGQGPGVLDMRELEALTK